MLTFVYGTLKKGGVNEPMLANEEFLGECAIPDGKYTLYEVRGRWLFPALVPSKHSHPIYGELYNVSKDCLTMLDRLEGVSIGLYKRANVSVIDVKGQEYHDVIAYEYLRPINNLELVGSVWPKGYLPRKRVLGFDVTIVKQTLPWDGFALWNKNKETFVTPVFESHEALVQHCKPKFHAFGGNNEQPWNLNNFEIKQTQETSEVSKCKIFSSNEESPLFDNSDDLASWAADNLFFFGGRKGTLNEWKQSLMEIMPKVESE